MLHYELQRLCHSKLVFSFEFKKCSHKCYEVLLQGVKPRLCDHPEGGPAVCSSDSGTRRRVRSIWPSGGVHPPQGTGLKRRRRAWRRTKGGRTRPDRYTNAYKAARACPSTRMPVRTHILMHARTYARTHIRIPSVIHNIVNPTHTPSVRSQSPSDNEIKPALRRRRTTHVNARGETRCVSRD